MPLGKASEGPLSMIGGTRAFFSRPSSFWGHLEKYEVPERERKVPPFSITQVIENDANRKSRFRFT